MKANPKCCNTFGNKCSHLEEHNEIFTKCEGIDNTCVKHGCTPVLDLDALAGRVAALEARPNIQLIQTQESPNGHYEKPKPTEPEQYICENAGKCKLHFCWWQNRHPLPSDEGDMCHSTDGGIWGSKIIKVLEASRRAAEREAKEQEAAKWPDFKAKLVRLQKTDYGWDIVNKETGLTAGHIEWSDNVNEYGAKTCDGWCLIPRTLLAVAKFCQEATLKRITCPTCGHVKEEA